MSVRSFAYWFLCSAFAVIAVGAAEPGVVDTATFMLPADASAIHAVPEPGRAFLLFAGIMAMAFTYRRAWLNWKRAS
ncbi:MAG: PEP-CTERM sorting domain-containing protein [Verrucomicrobiaceae bacterium]